MVITVSTQSRRSSQAALGLLHAPLALELERLGHHGDRQRAEFGGEARDDRRRAGAGAAAEARGDEHHVGAVERLDQLLGVLERGFAADRSDPRRRRGPW